MSLPLILTILAGASTMIGGFLSIFTKKPSDRLLAFSLGFAAGIMLLISLMEMLPAAINEPGSSPILCYSAFLIGLICYFGIDKLLPHVHPHDLMHHDTLNETAFSQQRQLKLKRTAMLLTLGISLHNFPEGIATFVTTSADWELGVGIAFAVAIHNIPEGIAVATPVYMATQSKKQALFWAAISGASEILGGLIAFFVLGPSIPLGIMSIIISAVAGIMVALSIDELIPLASEMHPRNNPSIGILCGMSVMGFSLIILEYL